MNRQYLLAIMGIMTLIGCSADDSSKPADTSKTAGIAAPGRQIAPDAPLDFATIAADAVNSPDRPAADIEADERRKPASTLAFFQVAPGMTVFEIEAGAGYYTELLSRAVTADGVIYMHNPEGFIEFVGEDIKTRLADGRLGNVRQTLSNFDELDAEDGSVDLVTWVQGPHELYFVPSEGVTLGDPVRTYKEIERILKPGGAFIVIDHSAQAGSPETSGNDLHRVDRNIVFEMAEEAGLLFEKEADFLINDDDTLEKNVFDPEIRGVTDQFILRFVKPVE